MNFTERERESIAVHESIQSISVRSGGGWKMKFFFVRFDHEHTILYLYSEIPIPINK